MWVYVQLDNSFPPIQVFENITQLAIFIKGKYPVIKKFLDEDIIDDYHQHVHDGSVVEEVNYTKIHTYLFASHDEPGHQQVFGSAQGPDPLTAWGTFLRDSGMEDRPHYYYRLDPDETHCHEW